MFSKLALMPFLLVLALAICVNGQNISRKVPPGTSSSQNVSRHPHHPQGPQHPHHPHHPQGPQHPHHPRHGHEPAPPPSFSPPTPPPSTDLKLPPFPSSPAVEAPPLESNDISVGVNGNVSVGAQDPEIQDLLYAHNAARRPLGLEIMQWDERLATYAQQYAERRSADCSIIHSGGPYGENIAWSSGDDLSAISAVQMWVDEAVFYDYATNTCQADEQCGHYTQVVWRDTARLGCGKVACSNGGGTFLCCSYDPPGNYVGERPY